MATKLFSFALGLLLLVNWCLALRCRRCHEVDCSPPPKTCTYGLTKDACNCCNICAKTLDYDQLDPPSSPHKFPVGRYDGLDYDQVEPPSSPYKFPAGGYDSLDYVQVEPPSSLHKFPVGKYDVLDYDQVVPPSSPHKFPVGGYNALDYGQVEPPSSPHKFPVGGYKALAYGQVEPHFSPHVIPAGRYDALEESGEFQGDIMLTQRQKSLMKLRGAQNMEEKLWKNAEIPYSISSEFSISERQMIDKAIYEFQTKTCLRFLKRTSQTDYIDIIPPPPPRGGCRSFVGRINGKQNLELAQTCFNKFGTILHEFMHATGFWHEQSRSDRDYYVIINEDNIKPNHTDNFDRLDVQGLNLLYKCRGKNTNNGASNDL